MRHAIVGYRCLCVVSDRRSRWKDAVLYGAYENISNRNFVVELKFRVHIVWSYIMCGRFVAVTVRLTLDADV